MDDILSNFFHRRSDLSSNEISTINKAIEKTLDYLEIYDLEHKTIRLPIFKDLYLKNTNLPLYRIASKYNLDVKSLYHYRVNYNYIVKMILYHKKF